MADQQWFCPDLYEEIVRLRRLGEPAALATIVRRVGSTPRKDHAKMLIRRDGTSLGSVGGGCVEAEIWQAARRVLEGRRAEVLRYQLTQEDASREGLVCGGSVEVFVEPILPEPRLVILGAGHVGLAVARAAQPLGFRITVIDDRENFADPERFPGVEEVLVQPFEQGLENLKTHSETFILIVTRGHSHDQVALEGAIRVPARYVGLVGSRRKIGILVESLLEKGYPPAAFESLYAPIGLEIGSETPEEIAVSVMAELIALQKGVHRRSEKQQFVRKILAQHTADKEGKAPPEQVAAGDQARAKP